MALPVPHSQLIVTTKEGGTITIDVTYQSECHRLLTAMENFGFIIVPVTGNAHQVLYRDDVRSAAINVIVAG